MRTAVTKTIRDVSLIILAGIIYYLIYRLTGWGIPCVFREVTGLRCPSCGISHMFIHLSSGQFRSAYQDNQFLFFTWPLVAAEIVYIIYRNESGKDLPKKNVIMISVFAVLLATFGILRIIYSW